jgi:phosphate transport system substrate-binding protein
MLLLILKKNWISVNNLQFICFYLTFFFATNIFADQFQVVVSNGMRVGPAFTKPDHVEYMDKNWKQQTIQYKKLPENTDLAISLDQHLYVALLPLIKQFGKLHNLNIAVQEGTCGISSGALYDKKVDMGGFCCPAGKTDRLPGLKFHTLAIASIAVITHPQNKINNISLLEARQIFHGSLGNYSELESNKGNIQVAENRIKPIARIHCKFRPGHWRLLLSTADDMSPLVTEISTIKNMIKLVASDKRALGYETIWMIKNHIDQGRVKHLRINGISPKDHLALLNSEYPFYRTYNITSWAPKHLEKPKIKQLISFLIENFNQIDTKYGLLSAKLLREHGWIFKENELIGEPKK